MTQYKDDDVEPMDTSPDIYFTQTGEFENTSNALTYCLPKSVVIQPHITPSQPAWKSNQSEATLPVCNSIQHSQLSQSNQLSQPSQLSQPKPIIIEPDNSATVIDNINSIITEFVATTCKMFKMMNKTHRPEF